MKKLITICLLLFSITTMSFGQTKEETISWLKEKMTTNLKGKYYSKGPMFFSNIVQSFTINECELLIKMKEETVKNLYSFYDLTIPMQMLSIDSDGGLNNYGIKYVLTQSTYYHEGIGEPRIEKSSAPYVTIDFSKEENLRDRIQKALDHLATFCPPKKKETF